MKPEQIEQFSQDKNVMPSMVVRQQRFQINGISSANVTNTTNTTNNNIHHTLPTSGISGLITKSDPQQQQQQIPYKPTELQHQIPATASGSIKAANDLSGLIQLQQQHQQQQQPQQLFDQDGLVIPKRILHHPVSVAQPIIRDLNRELKFNQIRGKNVLDQKSELKKAMEKLEETKRKKEAEQERLNRRTSLELRLEERAERIAKETTGVAAKFGSNLKPQLVTRGGEGGNHMADSQSVALEPRPQSAVPKQSSNFSLKSISR